MKVPDVLEPDDAQQRARAVELLACYYGLAPHDRHGSYTGARFDTWNTLPWAADPDRFTSDDLVAVSFLSVEVKATAAERLLDTQASMFARLLRDLGPDRDLVRETEAWPDEWAGWRLWAALDALPGVGATTASKLLARKRPALRPIYDEKVADALGTKNLWEPMRALLQERPGLHGHLLDLRDAAGVSPVVTALRVFDVVVWMDAWGARDWSRWHPS